MIRLIDDITALSFMSLFNEMRSDQCWHELCEWVGAGKSTPCLHYGVFDNFRLVGLFPCEAYTDRIMIHACFLPEYRGEFAREAAKDVFRIIFHDTKYDKIQAYIESEHVKKYARECGMIEKDGLFEVERWAVL